MRPIKNRVLVRPEKNETGKIELVVKQKVKGNVVSIGPKVDGVKAGDQVLFGPDFDSFTLVANGNGPEEFLLMDDDNIKLVLGE